MRCGKIHAAAYIDYRSVQCLRELDKALYTFLRTRGPVGQNYRIFCSDEHLGRFGNRSAVTLWWNRESELRNAELLFVVDRFFREVAVGGNEHGAHGHRGGYFISAHHRLGKVL